MPRMRTYAFPAVVEREGEVYGAYFPDLPGCGTVGNSPDHLAEMAGEALHMHLSGMLQDGEPIPSPSGLGDLPRDPEVNQVGVMLVAAIPGREVTLPISEAVLSRADAEAAARGQTRVRFLADQVEALFAA